jgi:hypothetical protein
MDRLEDADDFRHAEENALIDAINREVQAGKDEMRGLPLVKRPVLNQDGKPASAEQLKSDYLVNSVTGLGQSKSDGASYGDPSWFAAGWSYDFGWEVTPRLRKADTNEAGELNSAEAMSPWRRIGGVEGNVRVLIDAQARGFFDLLSLNAMHGALTADVRASQGGRMGTTSFAQLSILGNEIIRPTTTTASATPGSTFRLVQEATETKGSPEASVVVPVWCLALRFFASAAVEAGVQYVVEGTAPTLDLTKGRHSPSATFGMNAYVEPFARATATGGAAVSVGIAEGGAQIGVELIRVGLPAGVSVVSSPSGAEDYTFRYSQGAKVTVNTLSGQVDAYAKVGVDPFSKKWKARLFGWSGASEELPLGAAPDKSFGIQSWAWQIYGSPMNDPGLKTRLLAELMNDLEGNN